MPAPKSSRANGLLGGRPQGSLNKLTIDKRIELEEIRKYIAQHVPQLLESQVKNAIGLKYLVARTKNGGKFEKVSQERLDAMLEGQDDGSIVLEVWDKDPNVTAFTDLLNRLVGKPTEHVELSGTDGNPIELALMTRLAAGRLKNSSGE